MTETDMNTVDVYDSNAGRAQWNHRLTGTYNQARKYVAYLITEGFSAQNIRMY